VIQILELICESGHVVESIAFDDAIHDSAEAAYALGKRSLPVLPRCEQCSATSFTLQSRPTRYTSLEAWSREAPAGSHFL
jgi:hypothetical protein